MRCIFCQNRVLDENFRYKYGEPVTVPHKGVAHRKCAERDLISRRVFEHIDLSVISEKDLYELRELVLTEINAREGRNSKEAELF